MLRLPQYFLLILSIIYIQIAVAQDTKQYLHLDWKLRQETKTDWMETKVPGTVHQTLINLKKIPDPFYANNLEKCAWVENEEWEYALYFNVQENIASKREINLVFEGLDTYCEVRLNGKLIITGNNMFVRYEKDVTDILKKQGNYLTVRINNIVRHAKKLEKESKLPLPNDYRAFIRKAAFNFGWDFAPRLVTAGIYKPVYLQAGSTPLTKLGKYKNVKPFAKYDTTKCAFIANGKTVFIKGANFIPPSSLNYAISNTYYDSIMYWCKNANINMLRVWGGGVYPSDYFYEACTKNKIMVWQDFMQANAMPPIDFNYSFSFLEEVKQQVSRLAKYPCVVLWCGNNEVDEGWKNWGWKKNLNITQQTELYKNYTQLFEIDIPNYIANIDTSRTYIPTSPKYGWGTPTSMTNGDAHYWGVWWGKEPLENYYNKVPRFMSEYGMQALPDIHSIMQMCEAKDLNLDSTNFKSHQKLENGFETIKHYLKDYFPANRNNEAFIYYTQLLQRDAMVNAISAHRSAFPYCNGIMFWQFNDCWPAISWSVIDYFNRPKASYYALNEAYDDNFLTVSKKIFENNKNIIDSTKYSYVMSLNDATFDISKCETIFTVYDFYGEIIYSSNEVPWQKTKAGVYYTLPFFKKNVFEGFNWPLNYLVVDVYDNKKIKIHKAFTFSNLKDLKLQNASITQNWLNDTTLSIEANSFAKDVYLHSSSAKTTFNQNYFNMMPNEKHTIIVKNFNVKKDTLQVLSAVDMSAE